jgi:hypothetical protein
MVLAFLTYTFVLSYGAMIMNSVVEEKTNRIVEVIVSSCRPMELMMGKIIGVGLVGLTQFAIWVVLLSIGSAILGLVGGASMVANPEAVTAGMNLPGEAGAAGAISDRMAEIPEDQVLTDMRQMKTLTPEKVKSYADMFAKVMEDGFRYSAGGASVIRRNSSLFDEILNPFAGE